MKIVTICGAGIGTSGILKVNAERALQRLGLSATVVAADIASVTRVAADAQVILTSAEFVEAIGATRADCSARPLRPPAQAARSGRPLRPPAQVARSGRPLSPPRGARGR
mgnify:CR=1 FL=1